MLLGFYLATGQDAANIVEGSQSINHAEVTKEGDLYFSTTLPNLIVGTVGNGKGLDFVLDNLVQLGCTQEDVEPGTNARRLACIAAQPHFVANFLYWPHKPIRVSSWKPTLNLNAVKTL